MISTLLGPIPPTTTHIVCFILLRRRIRTCTGHYLLLQDTPCCFKVTTSDIGPCVRFYAAGVAREWEKFICQVSPPRNVDLHGRILAICRPDPGGLMYSPKAPRLLHLSRCPFVGEYMFSGYQSTQRVVPLLFMILDSCSFLHVALPQH